jgi:hypothetical protein
MYQKCPICNGSGRSTQAVLSNNSNSSEECPVCVGTRIISTLNGLPPKIEKTVDIKEELSKQAWLMYTIPVSIEYGNLVIIDEETQCKCFGGNKNNFGGICNLCGN